MEFELLAWGDGTVRLAYWDSLHGEDIIFILESDGARRVSYDGEEELLQPVDLIAELRKLAIEKTGQAAL